MEKLSVLCLVRSHASNSPWKYRLSALDHGDILLVEHNPNPAVMASK